MSKHIILFVALESELPRELVPENVSIYYTGVGKVNAAIKATQVITGFQTAGWVAEDVIVLNYGSAGSNTIPKGTLADCRYFIQNDMNTPFGKAHETPFDSEVYPEIKNQQLNLVLDMCVERRISLRTIHKVYSIWKHTQLQRYVRYMGLTLLLTNILVMMVM
jgi:hypothetical protein